jgi:pyridoxine 5-phosphate synthase
MKIVEDVCPAQVTLVPDSPNQLTSNHGWNTIKEKELINKGYFSYEKSMPCVCFC